MDIKEKYSDLLTSACNTFERSFEGEELVHAANKAHNNLVTVANIERWTIGTAFGDMIGRANSELQQSFFSMLVGNYKSSYFSLRSSMELVLSASFFQANETIYKHWLRAKRDISWSELVDGPHGPFSEHFLIAYNERLKSKAAEFQSLSKKLYRELSGVIHNNPDNLASHLPHFEQELSARDKVEDSIDTVAAIALFLFILQIGETEDPAHATEQADAALDRFGQTEAIRIMYS